MTDNIVERLRLLVPSDSSGAAFDAVNEITRLRNELHIAQEWSARVIAGHEQDIAEITALRAENERLRAALEKLSCKCPSNCDWEKHGDICPSWVASAALEEK